MSTSTFVPQPPPDMPPRDMFMPGDKVVERIGCGIVSDIFRVKARFAVCDIDYITLQNVENRNEHTIAYYPLAKRLEIVCKAQ